MLASGNHHYKKNSIALLPLPEGINPHANSFPQNWAHEYIGRQCDLEISIHLDRHGKYQILPLTNERFKVGIWRITSSPYVEFKSLKGNFRFYFELKKYTEKDQVGEIQIHELTPVNKSPLFANCKFLYGLRQ